MNALSLLIGDVDGSLRRGAGVDHARTLSRITDLLVRDAGSLTGDQIALFDVVIQRFATAIETRARVELAERLAPLANGPSGTLRTLAYDEIVVARPVLALSPCLDDQDLMAIAIDRGRDHMLAICERREIAECVSDVLVTRGDGVVRHAIVGNSGAHFSASAAATLIEICRSDHALGDLLGSRSDLPPANQRQLIEIAKDAARQRLGAVLPSGSGGEIDRAVERGASAVAAAFRGPHSANAPVSSLLAGGEPGESELEALADEGRRDATIDALADLTGLSFRSIDDIFTTQDNDLLIVIGKARGWRWRTIRSLLRLRNPEMKERHHFRRAEETFESLSSDTARRVLHFLRIRDQAGMSGGRPAQVLR